MLFILRIKFENKIFYLLQYFENILIFRFFVLLLLKVIIQYIYEYKQFANLLLYSAYWKSR